MVLRQDPGRQGQDGVRASSLMPQSRGAQVQSWMALCGPPAHVLLRVPVGSMRSAYGCGVEVKTRETPSLGTQTTHREADSCHRPPAVQSRLPQRRPRLWRGSADGFPRVPWGPATLLEPKKTMSVIGRGSWAPGGSQVC